MEHTGLDGAPEKGKERHRPIEEQGFITALAQQSRLSESKNILLNGYSATGDCLNACVTQYVELKDVTSAYRSNDSTPVAYEKSSEETSPSYYTAHALDDESTVNAAGDIATLIRTSRRLARLADEVLAKRTAWTHDFDRLAHSREFLKRSSSDLMKLMQDLHNPKHEVTKVAPVVATPQRVVGKPRKSPPLRAYGPMADLDGDMGAPFADVADKQLFSKSHASQHKLQIINDPSARYPENPGEGISLHRLEDTEAPTAELTGTYKSSSGQISEPMIESMLNGVAVSSFPDSAAAANFISESYIKRHCIKIDRDWQWAKDPIAGNSDFTILF